jgi:hypothetical protein
VARDDAGGTGPGSRCLYTAPASRHGPTTPCRGPVCPGTPSGVLDGGTPQRLSATATLTSPASAATRRSPTSPQGSCLRQLILGSRKPKACG